MIGCRTASLGASAGMAVVPRPGTLGISRSVSSQIPVRKPPGLDQDHADPVSGHLHPQRVGERFECMLRPLYQPVSGVVIRP